MQGAWSWPTRMGARWHAGRRLEQFVRSHRTGSDTDESRGLVASDVSTRTRDDDPLLRVHRRVREDLRRKQFMIYLTAAVSLFLFVYLFAALIRPEWF